MPQKKKKKNTTVKVRKFRQKTFHCSTISLFLLSCGNWRKLQASLFDCFCVFSKERGIKSRFFYLPLMSLSRLKESIGWHQQHVLHMLRSANLRRLQINFSSSYSAKKNVFSFRWNSRQGKKTSRISRKKNGKNNSWKQNTSKPV